MRSDRYVHPEFGLLSPMPRLRRELRMAFARSRTTWAIGRLHRRCATPPSRRIASKVFGGIELGLRTCAEVGKVTRAFATAL